MKALVTGVKGQLGYDVMKVLEARGYEGVGVDVEDMDITDEAAVRRVIGEVKPDVIVHCAAYTAVDAAEDNVELCRKINVDGTLNIAKQAKELDAKMIYISTDYVFNGQGEEPWEPDDPNKEPLNVYGQSKYDGELAVINTLDKYYIVRISWVFGENGKNFVKTMLRVGKEKGVAKVVDDQIGSPTYTADLAELLVDMAEREEYGTYHATNEGLCSWYEFTKEIYKQAGLDVDLSPCSSDEFPAKANRPSNSRMSKDKLEKHGFKRLPSWQDALSRFLKCIEY
ncbi:MAG: dTDP-4-dehydrorhamnose reductase [Lachnospiraceae bacterium]|nr:dTDP-4-dehydrorhamnose reductase [Lachnospiraceae bacterium]